MLYRMVPAANPTLLAVALLLERRLRLASFIVFLLLTMGTHYGMLRTHTKAFWTTSSKMTFPFLKR